MNATKMGTKLRTYILRGEQYIFPVGIANMELKRRVAEC